MADGEDWLYRPVLARVLDPRALTDGSIDMRGVALLNEALDVERENERRAAAHAAAQKQRR